MNKETVEQAGTDYANSWHGESNQYTEPEFSYTKRDFIAGWEACQQSNESQPSEAFKVIGQFEYDYVNQTEKYTDLSQSPSEAGDKELTEAASRISMKTISEYQNGDLLTKWNEIESYLEDWCHQQIDTPDPQQVFQWFTENYLPPTPKK